MKLLILGGTIFVGRHLVAEALKRGHEVTLFNRGKHNPDLFPDVERIVGDRKNVDDLAKLKGRSWDAVIDTCGYLPGDVEQSAAALQAGVSVYCFISSISVYADWTQLEITEEAPVATLTDPTVQEVTGETYGGLKALCEAAAEAAFPGKALNIRPGLIVGPDDISYRFSYWPHRIAQGGEVLAPGDPETPQQFIDVRDLVEWTLDLLEAGKTGIYNGTGPDYLLTMGKVLETCVQESGSDATLTWVSEEFLVEKEVQPWLELPLWIPASNNEPGHSAVSVAKSVASGLTFRPLAETVRATLEWDCALPPNEGYPRTLKPEKEQAILAAWNSRERE
jgi:2'-hydroxyisoflavone reductase